jgi:hypothetical protein
MAKNPDKLVMDGWRRDIQFRMKRNRYKMDLHFLSRLTLCTLQATSLLGLSLSLEFANFSSGTFFGKLEKPLQSLYFEYYFDFSGTFGGDLKT